MLNIERADNRESAINPISLSNTTFQPTTKSPASTGLLICDQVRLNLVRDSVTLIAGTELFAVVSNDHGAGRFAVERLDGIFAGDFAVQNSCTGGIDDSALISLLWAGERRTCSQDRKCKTKGDGFFHDRDLR